MSVDSVNNSSNNTGLYTAGGIVLGAGAGAAAGYYTKSYLKDGAPTDSFCKKLGDNLIETMPEEQKKIFKQILPAVEKVTSSDVKTAEELKNLTMDVLNSATADCKTLPEFFDAVNGDNFFGKSLINTDDAELLSKIGDAKSIEEAKQIISASIEKDISTVGFEKAKAQLKGAFDAIRDLGYPLTKKDYGKKAWELAYDSTKNKLVKGELEDEAFGAVKKTLREVKLKTAGIYGAIGAAVLGTVGYLCGAFGGNKAQEAQTPNNIDKQA